MKYFLLLLATALIGLALGTFSGLYGLRPFSSGLVLAQPPTEETLARNTGESAPPPLAPAEGPQPKAVVHQPSYNFGFLERGAEDSHTFVIRNEGEAPLVLRQGSTTCKCTLSKLGNTTVAEGERAELSVAPGEQVDVTLSWTVQSTIPTPTFRQTATVLTNDREQPKIELVIHGRISQTVYPKPESLAIGSLLRHDTKTASYVVVSHRDTPLELGPLTFTSPATSEFFDVTWEPLSEAELAELAAKSGYRVQVLVKPGLPLGQIQQRIRLATNVEQLAQVEVPVLGQIDSDFAIGGGGYNPLVRLLNLGTIGSQRGEKRTLTLSVRGPHREAVELGEPRTDPTLLRAELGEREVHDNVVQYPLTVEIPPGSPAVNHLGTQQGDYGKIVIPTTHPETPEVEIRVRFAVDSQK